MKILNQPARSFLLALFSIAFGSSPSRASIAYGSINNFDTVNDTGHECHGFEIEIEDCHSTEISSTYNYNHYGVPKITEDSSIPAHPKCVIRWESKKNADGSWAAYTAIPAGPINPTNGHMFTNPSINFGGEHFGVGYRAAVGAVRYNWLIDDGGGTLVRGGAVQVSTPSFTYYPGAGGNAAPQVQAVIAPPPPPAPEPKEFGKAVWVKEIRTTSHNNNEVKLRDLVSDDPDDANDKNWRNGEPDEVETEWQILQKDYNKADGGANNEVPAAAEDLPGGDEVVTRRYEFFKYIGPHDNESGEAMCQSVAPDGIHGVGTKTINGAVVDLGTVEVVGEFTGAQMAAVDVDGAVGLIEHVSEGEVNEAYAARTLVIEGALPFTCIRDGDLPGGMAFDEITGVLSGTPAASGDFSFTVTASDGFNPDVSKNYTLRVAEAGGLLDPANLVDTSVVPVGAGTTAGDGSYLPGSEASVTATPLAGYRFVNWMDHGAVVSVATTHTFTSDVNHSLIANFTVDLPQSNISTSASPAAGGTTSGAGLADVDSSITVDATANPGYAFSGWTEGGFPVSGAASYTFSVTGDRSLVANFTTVPIYSVTTGELPAAGGSTSGSGSYSGGTSATVSATANSGYVFTKWTVNGSQVSVSPSYSFTVTAGRTLVANFVVAGTQQTITTSANPTAWGVAEGGGNYSSGDSATVVATPTADHAFSKWQEGGTTVSNSASYTFTVSGSRTLVAKFIEAFVVNLSSSPGVGGTTEIDSLAYKSGESAQAKAFPESGFSFSNWTENGVVVSTDTTYSFDISGNRTLLANFISDSDVTINAAAAPFEGGTTSGDDVYSVDDSVTVSAVPNEGFIFTQWTEGGLAVSYDADYTFTATSSRALVAHFAVPYTITAGTSSAIGGMVEGEGIYPGGSGTTLTATPNPGYLFTGWMENGSVVSTLESYTFTVDTTRILTAGFEIIPSLDAAQETTALGMMELSWPAASANWILQESPDMKSGSWKDSTSGINNRGSRIIIEVPTSEGSRFFRLMRP